MAWCPQIINKVTIVALVWNDIQHFLFYVDQDKHVCDSSQLILFPHILREFLLLLRLGFARWAVSPDVDLCGVFKQCQKKPEAYYKGLPSTITISHHYRSIQLSHAYRPTVFPHRHPHPLLTLLLHQPLWTTPLVTFPATALST